MEVFGIHSNDPSKVGDDNYKKKSNPIGGNSSILEVLKHSQETQNEILEVVRNGSPALLDEQRKNTEQLTLNTKAIMDLIHALGNIKADVTVSGLDSKLLNSMAKLGNSDAKMLGIEKFGDIYESVVKKIAGLSQYTKQIDSVTESVIGAFGTIKELGKGLLVFAGGLALLGFTLITFMSEITISDMMTFAGIMGVLWASSKLIGKSSWNFAKASLGIATLGLAVWAFTEVVNEDLGLSFIASMTYISAGLAILMLVSDSVGKGSMGIMKGAGAIVAIAGSIWLLNKAVSDFDDVDLIQVGKMILVTAGLGAVWAGMGYLMTPILQGSIASVAIGASLWVLSKGVQEMGKIDMTLGRGLELAAITIATAGILTLIGNPITLGFTLAGAGATALIGGALWALSLGMKAISTVTVTGEQSKEFANSIVNVVDALSVLGNPLTLARMVLSVPASLALSGATLALSGAIWAVSKMPQLGDKKRDEFSHTLNSLVGVYSDLGVWGLAKATAASAIVAVISGATMVSAGAIWAFTKISANPNAVDTAVLSLDNFITGVSTSFRNNEKNFGSIQKGVHSFMGLSSMVSEIADSVRRISNLEFLEKSVRNGKVVVTGVRSFTPNDFKNVGVAIGQMLNALTDPLSKIASQKDTYSIGGFEITNPFSNKVQDGIEAMAGIGGVFSPLANVLDVFFKNGIGGTKIQQFNKNIGAMLQGIGTAFNGTQEIDEDILEGMQGASMLVGDLIGYVTDEKFGAGSDSFKSFSKNIASVKDSLNAIDLDKLSKFNDLVFNMNELDKSNALDEFVDAFKQFLDHLVSMDRGSSSAPTETTNTQTTIYKETTKEGVAQGNTIDSETMRSIISDSNGDVVEIMNKVYNFLISGGLKVQLKEDLI